MYKKMYNYPSRSSQTISRIPGLVPETFIYDECLYIIIGKFQMAVIKLAKSGNSVQIVIGNEDVKPGTIFSISKKLLEMMLDKQTKGSMAVLSRFAVGTNPDRFKVSPIWGDSHTDERKDDGVDALGSKFEKERSERKANNTGHAPW